MNDYRKIAGTKVIKSQNESQEIKALFKKLTNSNEVELHCILNLIYFCGIEKKEVCSVTIGDVKKQNSIYLIDTRSKKKKGPVKIDNEAYKIFNNYLLNLTQHSETNSNSPIFPNYYGSSGQRNLARHLVKYSSSSIDVNMIHSAGIKSYFKTLLNSKTDRNSIYKLVAGKFRLSPKAVKDQCEGTIKAAGEKKLSGLEKRDLEILRLFDTLGSLHNSLKISDLTKDFRNKIEHYDLSDEDKNNLIKMWEDKVFLQTSGESLSDQINKNVGALNIIEIMEMIHKPYLPSDFDKKLIEEEYIKMSDYFFPKNE